MSQAIANASVDVIIPAFNAARYIEQTVRSIVAQTLSPARIIVVDDGSTDDTADRVRALQAEFEDVRLDLVSQPNQGLSSARNAGLRAATGIFAALLDADDIWLPAKLERQLAVFAAGSTALGVVYCDYAQIDENGEALSLPRYALNQAVRGNVLPQLLERNCIAGSASAVVVRRELFERAGYFDTDLTAAEDWDMWLRLAAVCEFDYVPETLVQIRRHAQSMQASPVKMLNGELRLLDKQARRGMTSKALVTRLRKTVALHGIAVSSLHCWPALSAPVKAAFSGAPFDLWCVAYRLWRSLVELAKTLLRR